MPALSFDAVLWIVFASLAALVVGGIYLYFRSGWVRTERLQELATSRGLQFLLQAEVPSTGLKIKLFSRGEKQSARNLVHGQTQNVTVRVFDFTYHSYRKEAKRNWLSGRRVGWGLFSTARTKRWTGTDSLTVALIESDALGLVDFDLRPENLLDKLASLVGFQDIDFETHPEFSRRFRLRSQTGEAVRRHFTPQVLEFLERHAGICVEGNGRWLACYWDGRCAKPDACSDLLDFALELQGLLKEPAGSLAAHPAR